MPATKSVYLAFIFHILLDSFNVYGWIDFLTNIMVMIGYQNNRPDLPTTPTKEAYIAEKRRRRTEPPPRRMADP